MTRRQLHHARGHDPVQGNHVQQVWPWDLALLPVLETSWNGLKHSSRAIQEDQIALAPSVLLPASARLSRLIDPALRIDHLRSFSGAFQFQLS
jgi:hypothetical protein